MSKKYSQPIKVLGGSALIALIFALIIPSLTSGIADEHIREGVLVQALPFFGAFVCILLSYILIIWLIAARFNGKIPQRTHNAIEIVLIIGILGGVFLLFQSILFVGYRYGFPLVLFALLSFIGWSHVIGRASKSGDPLPKFTLVQHLAGMVAFVIVVALISGMILNANAPREPYGVRQRLWNSYNDSRRAEIAAAANADFDSVEVPFVIGISFLPAALFFFGVREVAASFTSSEERVRKSSASAPSRSSV